MNIAFLVVEYPPNINGGLGRYAEIISEYLIKNGECLKLLALNPGTLPVTEIKAGISIYRPLRVWLKRFLLSEKVGERHCLNSFINWLNLILYNIDSFRLVKKLHRESPVDLIAVHDWMSSLAGVLCCLFSRIPVVFHIHNTENTMTKWGRSRDFLRIIWLGERLLALFAKKIIVPTAEMRQLLVNHKWDAQKIEVVSHGYNPDYWLKWATALKAGKEVAALKRKLQISAETRIIVFAGRLAYVKGVFELIAAMRLVVAEHPHTKLIMIGTGENTVINREVTSLISKLQLSDQIYLYQRFLSTKQVMLHYSIADICIFPSKYEPFGLVALEAMGLGKPVILGKGFSRVFAGSEQNPAVVYVDGDSPGDIAQHILALLNDREAALQIGKNAIDHVHANFDWSQAVARTIRIYSNTVKDVALS